MRADIESFLHKKMSRKDFLRHIGLIVLSVFGVANLINYLANSGNFTSNTQKSTGYGMSPYGGTGKKSQPFTGWM